MSERVRRYHRLGRRANDQELSSTKLARRRGLGLSTARKAKDFARKYTKAQVEAFLRLRRPNGLPLHWGHIWVLLTLPHKSGTDKKRRRDLQEAAADKDWTAPELYRQIKLSAPGNCRWASKGRGRGGRPSKNKPGSRAFLESLAAQARKLARDLSGHIERSIGSARAFRSRIESLEGIADWLKKLPVK